VEFASAQTTTPSTHIAPIKTDKNTFFEVFMAQRPELRHAGPTSVNREAELDRPSRVGSGDLLGSTIMT
jgi:hypothetical protein